MIGIIGAMDVEINDLIENVTNVEKKEIGKYTFYKGLVNGVEVVILKSGIGKVASAVGASLMIELYKPACIINTGIAGGVLPLKSKDVVLTKTLSYGDVDATIFGYEKGQVPQMPTKYEGDSILISKVSKALDKNNIEYKLGHALTFDSFISTLKDKNVELKEENTICEMEGCSIAQTCYILGVPFLGVRYISDIIDSEKQVLDYFKFETEMAHLSSKIIKDIITLI